MSNIHVKPYIVQTTMQDICISALYAIITLKKNVTHVNSKDLSFNMLLIQILECKESRFMLILPKLVNNQSTHYVPHTT